MTCCSKQQEAQAVARADRSPQTLYWRNAFPGESCAEGFVRIPTYGSWGVTSLVDLDVSGIQCARTSEQGETQVVFKDGCHLFVQLPIRQFGNLVEWKAPILT